MYFQDIECCSTPIFSFLDLQELSKLKCQLWNKSIYQSIQYVIDQKKTNTILYQTILDPYFDKDDLEKTPIVFFSTLQKYMQSHHDTQFDFKNFLFHIFDKMTPNTAPSPIPPHSPLTPLPPARSARSARAGSCTSRGCPACPPAAGPASTAPARPPSARARPRRPTTARAPRRRARGAGRSARRGGLRG